MFSKIMLGKKAFTFNKCWQFGIILTFVYQGKKTEMRARRTNYKECFAKMAKTLGKDVCNGQFVASRARRRAENVKFVRYLLCFGDIKKKKKCFFKEAAKERCFWF